MSREHNDFINAADVGEELAADGPFAGAGKRLLSRDSGSGAETALVRFEAGWSGSLAGVPGELELLVLRGRLELGGRAVPTEGWARAPRADAARVLAAPEAAEALVMSDVSAAPDGEASVVDTRALPWRAGIRGGPGGIAVKTLHEGPTVSLLIANVPRYGSGAEFHECPEELYVLAGDVSGRAGTMTQGSYFWRPEFITHGPYWSESGLLTFVRGHGDIYAHWIEDADSTVDQNRAHAAAIRASGGRPA